MSRPNKAAGAVPKVETKVNLAATTAAQSRVSMFAATTRKRGKAERIVVQNAWGRAEVTADLTQIHRTVMDIIIGADDERIRRRRNADGSLEVAFAPHMVLRAIGFDKPGATAYRYLENLIEDLRVTRFRATFRRKKQNVEIEVTRNVGIVGTHGPVAANGITIGYGVKLSAEYMGYYAALLASVASRFYHLGGPGLGARRHGRPQKADPAPNCHRKNQPTLRLGRNQQSLRIYHD